MRLQSFQVENFRSIVKTQQLELDNGLTVIAGPNNEGKSNLLRAIVLAMNCLRGIRQPGVNSSSLRSIPEGTYRYPRGVYDWESDFPQQLQQKKEPGTTRLVLGFELNETDKNEFRRICYAQINENLEVELRLHTSTYEFRVLKKRGKGAASYSSKSKEISKFISGAFEFQYIPAIRPSELSLTVVGELLDRELSTLNEQEEYRAALKTIEDLQKPLIDSISADVQKYLKKLLPSVTSVSLSRQGIDGFRSRIRLPQFVVNDGTATELESKGDGIKSLVAISLMRAAKTGEKFGDLVVAIEEPESHLHPGAIRQLAEVLKEMAVEHQVIITTHSPLLASTDRVESNIIVSKSKATPCRSIREVREALGVEVSDNLVHAENVIVVEGKHDINILTNLMPKLSDDFARLLQARKVVFEEMLGTSNVAYKVTTIRTSIAKPILIFDDDSAGRKAMAQVREKKAVDEKYIFSIMLEGHDQTELEDLIDLSSCWDDLIDTFGITVRYEEFMSGREKWTERMRREFKRSGKPYSESVESNLKQYISDKVLERGLDVLSSPGKLLLERVTISISKMCGSK